MEKIQQEIETLTIMIDTLGDCIKQGASPVVVGEYCRRIMGQLLKVWGMASPPPLRGRSR